MVSQIDVFPLSAFWAWGRQCTLAANQIIGWELDKERRMTIESQFSLVVDLHHETSGYLVLHREHRREKREEKEAD